MGVLTLFMYEVFKRIKATRVIKGFTGVLLSFIKVSRCCMRRLIRLHEAFTRLYKGQNGFITVP